MTEITDAGIGALLQLPNLKELWLKDTPQLGDPIMKVFASMKGLTASFGVGHRLL